MLFISLYRQDPEQENQVSNVVGSFYLSSIHLELLGLIVMAWKVLKRQEVQIHIASAHSVKIETSLNPKVTEEIFQFQSYHCLQ